MRTLSPRGLQNDDEVVFGMPRPDTVSLDLQAKQIVA
jgi:hypothetical protein